MTENKTYSQLYVDLIINKVINIKNDFIRQVDEQLSKLQNLPPIVEPVEPERKKEWRQKLEYKETYFFIHNDGAIGCATWDDVSLDKKRYTTGNCFPCKLFTEEQVQQIAWQNQLNSLLSQYAIINNALASDEEVIDSEHFLWWVRGKKAVGNCEDYPHAPLFNNKTVAFQAIRDVVEPFCEAHPEFVW